MLDTIADRALSRAGGVAGLTSSPALPRGTVSLLFTDIEASTELARKVGASAYSQLLGSHHQLIRKALSAHDGREIDTAGDGFFAVFPDARGAVAAAIEAQRALGSFDWPAGETVRVRMGIHTGEPHVSEGRYTGAAVHRAARICTAGRGGQVLVSSATAGVIEDDETSGIALRDLGEHRLKGLGTAQRLFQLLAEGLVSEFGPLRTADQTGTPGSGTFLLTDLSGWRQVIRDMGDVASASLLDEYQARVGEAMEANHGTVVERIADQVVGVFHQAVDAIAAADSIGQHLRTTHWPEGLGISIVIHSGRWSGDPRHPTAGTALFRLGRVGAVAQRGQVVVTYATAALLDGDPCFSRLRDLGLVDVPDFDEPVRTYELLQPNQDQTVGL